MEWFNRIKKVETESKEGQIKTYEFLNDGSFLFRDSHGDLFCQECEAQPYYCDCDLDEETLSCRNYAVAQWMGY